MTKIYTTIDAGNADAAINVPIGAGEVTAASLKAMTEQEKAAFRSAIGAAAEPATATFYAAVKTSRAFTASDYTGSGISVTGALPVVLTVPGGSFNNLRYFGIWVPGTHPITSIDEGLNQIGAFTASALTVGGVAGTSYVSRNLFVSDASATTWVLRA